MTMFTLEMDYPPPKDNPSETKSVQLNELNRLNRQKKLEG